MKKPLATNEKNFIALQQKNFQELQCLNRVDAIFASKWMRDLEKISFKDLGEVPRRNFYKESSKATYNTAEQEWLIESGSASGEIDSCLRDIVREIVPLMSKSEVDCLNSIFVRHIQKEIEHEYKHKKVLEKDVGEQLPFRMYISFTEFVELMFQSRNPDALGSRERSVYRHAETFLNTEDDRLEPTYIVYSGCNWKNAKALREAPNANARFNEFLRQVQESVDKQLGNKILKNWKLTETLSSDKYLSWLDAREKMMLQINAEVEKLRTQNRDAQWLCDYAAQLAYRFWFPQSMTLVNYFNEHVLETSQFFRKLRSIRETLDKDNDIRYPVLRTLVNKYENVTGCLSAFYHLVENHQRFDIASAFVNDRYTYSEFYCETGILLYDNIRTQFCKCVGSFCVTHGIATLQREEYDLLQKPDGTYYVDVNKIWKERRDREDNMDRKLDRVQ